MNILGFVVVFALLVTASTLLYGWLFMLLLGVAASLFEAPVLAIGYTQAVLIAFVFALLTSRFSISR